MNALLTELNRLGVAHASSEDVFLFVDRLFHNFAFLFQTEESSPRRLELVSGLFEHLTVECVNDIVDACNHPDVPGTGGGGGSGAAGGGAAAEGGAATNAPVPMSTGNVSPSVVSSSKLSCDSPVFVPASATAAGCATPRAPAT
uniref:Protein UL91 n=1 Tax=Panine betaherpesvirus 2 TaxID=188763 RepID=A0A8F7K8T5_9BETA|nr:protein UL91 [Panine betaherpesvirus 2]